VKRLLIILAFFLVCLVSIAFFVKKPDNFVIAQSTNSSWPMVQGDVRHSGFVPQTVVPPYTKLWEIRRFPVSDRVQPIIAENKVFLGSNNGRFYAVNTSNGSDAWSFDASSPIVSSAAYEGGKVFFGATDGWVYSLNAANGTLLWKYQTGGSIKGAPVVAEGKVFIGSSDGYLYALNESNGTLAWRYNTKAPIWDTPAFDNSKVFFCAMDSKGYAINSVNGSLAWSIQLNGQGCRDRWTVAGNGHVFFTPVLDISHHDPLSAGTQMFWSTANPVIYNQPWSTQRQAILNLLASRPDFQPLTVVNQQTGQKPFTPPVMYVSGGSQSSHSQVALLPNGNAVVIYRRTFGEAAQWGPTTNDAIVTGELDLTTGDIIPIDFCQPGGGGWANCGNYKGPYTSDESSALTVSGNVVYLDIARGLVGLDRTNQRLLSTLACFNPTSGGPFCDGAVVQYTDYQNVAAGGGWRVNYNDLYQETSSDGNNTKRPTPIVGDTFYVLHLSTLTAVKGSLR